MRCFGVIVISRDLSSTLLVQDSKKNWSFPKGKREGKEAPLEAAFRELEEETGLTKSDLVMFPEKTFVDELSAKGNPAIRLFIGFLKDGVTTFTPKKGDEIESAKLVSLEKARQFLWHKRVIVLEKALKICKLFNSRTECLKECLEDVEASKNSVTE